MKLKVGSTIFTVPISSIKESLMVANNQLLNDTKPVSYTHLDVYKRQRTSYTLIMAYTRLCGGRLFIYHPLELVIVKIDYIAIVINVPVLILLSLIHICIGLSERKK